MPVPPRALLSRILFGRPSRACPFSVAQSASMMVAPALTTLAVIAASALLAACSGTGSSWDGSSANPDAGDGVVIGEGGSGSGSGTDNPSGVTLDAEEAAFLSIINEYRASKGLSALKVSASLTQAAKWLSTDMAAKNYFSHTDSGGRSYYTRIVAFGYSGGGTSGENIAAGNATAQATFTQWKNSSGHNANMLGSGYRTIGIGRAYGSKSAYGWYWTTDFGGAE